MPCRELTSNARTNPEYCVSLAATSRLGVPYSMSKVAADGSAFDPLSIRFQSAHGMAETSSRCTKCSVSKPKMTPAHIGKSTRSRSLANTPPFRLRKELRFWWATTSKPGHCYAPDMSNGEHYLKEMHNKAMEKNRWTA
jgi:hypothetical protein